MSSQLNEKLSSLKSRSSFILYCISFVVYGIGQTCLGPIIPYFSEKTGHPETEYSFLFLTRAIGEIFGALCIRFLTRFMTFHQILGSCTFALMALMIPFSLSFDLTFQTIATFAISTAASIVQIVVNLCLLQMQKDANVQFWMLICHGMFGIGGLLSPVLVYQFGTNLFIVTGILYFLTSPAYFLLQSPEKRNLRELQERKLVREQASTCMGETNHELNDVFPRRTISLRGEHLLYTLFFIYIGMDLGFGNWIPSYAVMEKIVTKQMAVHFSSTFWIAMTTFRFISSILPWKGAKKMIMLQAMLAFSIVTSIVLIKLDFVMAACYFSSLTFGMCFSPMFPLLMTVHTEYNLEMTPKQNANCQLATSFGIGSLVVLIGYLMAWFSSNMLFYTLLGFSVIFLLVGLGLIRQYQDQEKKVEIQLKQILIPKRNILKQR